MLSSTIVLSMLEVFLAAKNTSAVMNVLHWLQNVTTYYVHSTLSAVRDFSKPLQSVITPILIFFKEGKHQINLHNWNN